VVELNTLFWRFTVRNIPPEQPWYQRTPKAQDPHSATPPEAKYIYILNMNTVALYNMVHKYKGKVETGKCRPVGVIAVPVP
jgi:hypothetical protein